MIQATNSSSPFGFRFNFLIPAFWFEFASDSVYRSNTAVLCSSSPTWCSSKLIVFFGATILSISGAVVNQTQFNLKARSSAGSPFISLVSSFFSGVSLIAFLLRCSVLDHWFIDLFCFAFATSSQIGRIFFDLHCHLWSKHLLLRLGFLFSSMKFGCAPWSQTSVPALILTSDFYQIVMEPVCLG